MPRSIPITLLMLFTSLAASPHDPPRRREDPLWWLRNALTQVRFVSARYICGGPRTRNRPRRGLPEVARCLTGHIEGFIGRRTRRRAHAPTRRRACCRAADCTQRNLATPVLVVGDVNVAEAVALQELDQRAFRQLARASAKGLESNLSSSRPAPARSPGGPTGGRLTSVPLG